MFLLVVLFLMIRRPPRSTRTDTLFPYTTRFRSHPFDCPLLQSNFPPRNIAREKPDWFEKLEPDLQDMLAQTYNALHIGADRLVAMGTRAVLEMAIVKTCGDHRIFKAKNGRA